MDDMKSIGYSWGKQEEKTTDRRYGDASSTAYYAPRRAKGFSIKKLRRHREFRLYFLRSVQHCIVDLLHLIYRITGLGIGFVNILQHGPK
jgi:hypothetical protein